MRIRIQAIALPALLLAAACGDLSTGSAPQRDAEPTAPQVTRLLGTVTCHVDLVAHETKCGPAAASGTAGGPKLTRVLLDTSHFTLNPGPQFRSGGLEYIFTTLINDIGQDIGTHNGINSDTIRAFVKSITVTGGFGAVSAYNHVGTGTFTAANQPYWEWHEIVNAGGGESTTLLWQFSAAGTVTSFTYDVGLSAPIAHPNGWVSVSGDDQVPLGGSRTHTATVKDWLGNVVSSGVVLWTATNVSGDVDVTVLNSRQARIDGVAVGTAEVTASKGFETPRTYGVTVF
jgi:hypothetical protein